MAIVSNPSPGVTIVDENGIATNVMQIWIDDLAQTLNDKLLGNQVQLPSYAVAALPSAATAAGWIFVINETGGAVPAFSDGVNWLRCTDRAIVS